MTAKLRILWLALIAVLAACSVAAPAARAGFIETEGLVSATITGEQISGTITGSEVTQHKITTAAGVLRCNSVKFHGKREALSLGMLTVTPTFSGCTLGGFEAIVATNECDFEFRPQETVDPKNPDAIYTKAEIVCKATPEKPVHKIVITVPGTKCEVKIYGQAFGNEFVTENTTTAQPKMDIHMLIDLHEMNYSVTNGAECPNEPKDNIYLDGTYEGVSTVKAEETGGGNAIGFRVT